MPKEIVHWMVARRTAELLSSGPYGPALARCPKGLLVASVYHDVLFYLTGDHPEALKHLPHALHGADGQDTFALLALQAGHLHANQARPLPTAFFVGLASHVFADAVLHPMVYHHTGNYYDTDPARRTAAVRRHRTLEALMDMAAAGGPDAVRTQSLGELVDGMEEPLAQASPPALLARLCGAGEDQTARAVKDALSSYRTMQALCRSESLSSAAHALSPLLPAKAREIAALFYAPQLWEQRSALSGAIAYRNPASGQADSATLAGLMERAARQAADWCAAQAPEIIRSGRLAHVQGGASPGPSLDMGLPATTTGSAAHFAPRPLLAD